MLTARLTGSRWWAPAAWTALAVAGAIALFIIGKAVLMLGPLVLALPVLAALGVIAFTRPVFAVYALAFTSPLTSGMERGLIVPFFRANELVMFALVYVSAITFLARKRPIRFLWADGILLLFLFFRVALPTMVMLFRGEPWGAMAAKTLFGPVQYYVIYRMAVEFVDDQRQVRNVLFLMLTASGIVSVIGVLQALQVPGINAFLETWYPSNKNMFTFLFARRVTSLWAGDWNGVGVYLAMCMAMGLGTFHLFEERWRRVTVIVISVLNLVVMFLTASFTGIICAVLGLFILLARSPQAKHLARPLLIASPAVAVTLGAVFWKIVADRFQIQFGEVATTWVPLTFRVRITMWRELMWPYVERFWLWGLGPYQYGWPVEESYYMLLILKGGIFAVISYFVFLGGVFYQLSRYFRFTRFWPGATALVLWILFLQIAVANITGEHFEANGVSEILWILLGMLMGAELRGEGLASLESGAEKDRIRTP